MRFMGVSENRGSKYSTLNSRVLIIWTPPQISYPYSFRKLPFGKTKRASTLQEHLDLVVGAVLQPEAHDPELTSSVLLKKQGCGVRIFRV